MIVRHFHENQNVRIEKIVLMTVAACRNILCPTFICIIYNNRWEVESQLPAPMVFYLEVYINSFILFSIDCFEIHFPCHLKYIMMYNAIVPITMFSF